MNNKKRSLLQRFFIGLKVGWKTPTLPENILKFQLHPLIRVLRVIGGISTIYLVSNKAPLYNDLVLYLALFFSFLFFVYHCVISYYRIKHVIHILKSDKLDIKNSPLDHFARLSARLLVCVKGVCDQAQPVGVAMGIMLGVDTALERADNKPIFGPVLGSALKTVLPNTEAKLKTIDLLKKPVSQVETNNEEVKSLQDLIEKISSWSNTDENMKQDVKEIISEIDKRKSEIDKHTSVLQSEISKILKSNPFNSKKE